MSYTVVEVQFGGQNFSSVAAAMNAAVNDIAQATDSASRRVEPELLRFLQKMGKIMEDRHGKPWSPGSVSRDLRTRSGAGLRSILQSIKVSGGPQGVEGQISAGKLSFHETGGTIRAKANGFLTIPLPAALDARGVPLRKRAREWDNTFVKRSRRGNLLIFRKLPGPNELTPLYVLKPSVTIPPRLGLGDAIDENIGYFEMKLFALLERELDL